jgi:hypothetical protein
VVAYGSGAASPTGLTLFKLTSAGAVTGTPTTFAATNYSTAIAYSTVGGTGLLYVVYVDGSGAGSNVVGRIFNASTFAQTLGPFTIDAGRAANGSFISSTRDTAFANPFFAYSLLGVGTLGGVGVARIAPAGVVTTKTLRGIIGASGLSFVGSSANPDVIFLATNIPPSLPRGASVQPTLFVVNSSGQALARILPGLAS